ncbi:hypothetical protein F5H01DRAFT_348462 [Linnemannia elongata]|nr:hypothetical protein F5H01DRAFT_348462 [Linnemannia elongata]
MGGEAKLSRFEMKRKEKKIAGSRTALNVGVGNVKKVKRVYFHSRQFEAINKHTTRMSFDKKKNKEKTVRVLACQPGLPNQPHQPTDTNQRTTHSHRLLWQHKAPANTLHRLPRYVSGFSFLAYYRCLSVVDTASLFCIRQGQSVHSHASGTQLALATRAGIDYASLFVFLVFFWDGARVFLARRL